MDKPSSELDLSSVDAKLKWAVAHFEAVDKEISAWLEKNDYKVIPYRNAEFTHFWLTAHLPGDAPDFERWSLMLGDCFTNLRDTLDHAVYAIAQLPTSPRPEKRDKACFLTAASPDDFRDWSKTKLAGVPSPVRDIIRAFQSFNRPHPILPPLIGLLGELANGSKHKLLNVVMAMPGISVAQFKAVNSRNGEAKPRPGDTDIVHGSCILMLEFEHPEPTMEVEHLNSRLLVAVKHTPRDGNTEWGADRTPYDILFPILMHEVATILDAIRNAA